MILSEMRQKWETCPIIAAIHDSSFEEALLSPAEILFLLEGTVMNVAERIERTHKRGKSIFVHIDLMKGIGKDKCAVTYLASLGVDGIISTKAALIKAAKDAGLIAIQRFFAVDSQGLDSAKEMIASSHPDLIEIMPGVIDKVIRRFASEAIPVIAGGLIESKTEVTSALSSGAVAVSTGKKELWYL